MEKEKEIGRWLRDAHQVGQSLCEWVFTAKAIYIARLTLIAILEEQLLSTDLKERLLAFSDSVHIIIGDHKKAVIPGENLNEEDIYYDEVWCRYATNC